MNEATLEKDARNRTLRTFITGLAVDVSVGVALVLATFFVDKNSWGEIEWAILSFSIAKSVVQAVCAYVLRRFLDQSSVPTPLPPGDTP